MLFIMILIIQTKNVFLKLDIFLCILFSNYFYCYNVIQIIRLVTKTMSNCIFYNSMSDDIRAKDPPIARCVA